MENDEQKEFSNLQNNFIKQQAQISALKELVRKTEIANEKTSYTQEKVKNIAQRLTHIKSKVRTRENHDLSLGELSVEQSRISFECPYNSTSDIKISSEKPGSEKFLLLRQQMKQNKLKMAERENTKKEMEERVLKLKEKIDNTQISLEKSTELGRSMTELSSFSGTPVARFKSSADLSFIPLNIDKERIKFLENRIKFLEKQLDNDKELTNNYPTTNQIKLLESKILDLQGNLKEKECIIQSYTRECKNTEDLLGNQTNFSEFNDKEFDSLKSEILNLKEINNILEQTRFDLTIKNSKLELEIQDIHKSFTKTEELNKSLQNQIYSLMNKKVESFPEYEKEFVKLDGQDNEIVPDEINNSEKEASSLEITGEIKSLSMSLETERKKVELEISKTQEYKNKLMEKEVEYNVLHANFLVLEEKIKTSPKTLFSKTTDKVSEIEINKLKQQLDDSNKSMIKLKLKAKQLQKQIDGFGKISNVNNEYILLLEQNQKLQQKINDLQDENCQLSLLNKNDENNFPSNKIGLLETTCENQTSNILILQKEKIESIDRLQSMKNEMYTILKNLVEVVGENTMISDIESITLEEIILNFNTDIDKLQCLYNNYKEENLELQDLLHNSDVEKQCLHKNIEYYVNENADLLDKIEKLNKSNSSAESIVIVERLTQEEKDELAEFEKPTKFNLIQMPNNEYNQEYDTYSGAMNNDLCDSLVKLREESSELMYKIELFTVERKEVLDKMETLTNDNKKYIQRIVLLEQENVDLQENIMNLRHENSNMGKKMENISDENLKLNKEIVDLKSEKDASTINFENITSLTNKSFTQSFIIKFESHLEDIHKTIENYRKVNDKNSKLQASKKLAKQTELSIEELKNLIRNTAELGTISENIPATKMELAQNRERELKSQTPPIQDVNSLQLIFDTKIDMLEKENDILKTLNKELKQQLLESFNEKQETENYNHQLRIDLNNKEETIHIINSQLMDLYNSLEKKTAHLLEKEGAIVRFQEHLEANVLKINNLELKNNENKIIIDNQHLYEIQLQAKIVDLEQQNATLETKTVKQLDKLKKFAANIKKKNIDYNNLEEKIKVLEQKHNSDKQLLELNNDLQNKIFYFENKIQKINISKTQEINNIAEKQQLLETNLITVKNELNQKTQELNNFQNNLHSAMTECESLKNENLQLQQKKSSEDQNIEKQNNYIVDLLNEINMKNIKLEEFDVLVKEKEEEIEILKYESNNFNLANSSTSVINNELIVKYDELQKNNKELLHVYNKDKQSFRDTIFRVDNLYKLVEGKLNEYVSYVEILEAEHKNYKHIIFELEEIVFSFEKDISILNTQLQNKAEANDFKKETLINRLIMLWNNRELEKRLTFQELKVTDGISEIDSPQEDISASNNEIAAYAHQKQINEFDILTTQVKQNQTDDQALIENENKRLKDSLKQKEIEKKMYEKIILQLQPSILLPINLKSVAEVSNQKTINIQTTSNILQDETTDLKTILNTKHEQSDNLQIFHNQLETNVAITSKENMLDEDKSFSYHPGPFQEDIVPTLPRTGNMLFFDEIDSDHVKEPFTNIAQTQSISKEGKIEDLQRNVSDLEKYVADLENKIKHLTKMTEAASTNKLLTEKVENTHVPNETLVAVSTLYEEEKKRVQCFASRVEELELEQKRLEEEKQALQIKSGKIMKKLKEYKVKIDQQNHFINTGKSTCTGSSVDLDLTIQEEMKNEILRLEKNSTEIMKNLESEKVEKNNLLKRINILVANNERFVEKKELQDIQINNLQRDIRELKLKTMPEIDCEQQVHIKYKKDDGFENDDTIFNQEMHLKGDVEEVQAKLDKEIAMKCLLENQLKCLQEKIYTLENKFSIDQEYSIKCSNAEILNNELENENLRTQSNEYENDIEKLVNYSVIILKKFNSLREEIEKVLNENFKLNIDLQLATETNTTVEDIQLNSINTVQNTAFCLDQSLYENKISELMSQLQYREIEKIQLEDQVEQLKKNNHTCSIQEDTFEADSKMLAKDIIERNQCLQPIHDYNSADSSITNFTVEKNNIEKERIILNEHVLLGIKKIEENWNKKMRDFTDIWKSNILENGSISQESVNLLQSKLDELQFYNQKDNSLSGQENVINIEEENSNIIQNMTKAIENHKLEILTLKDELALKSVQRDPYAQISYSLESSPLARNSYISSSNSELDLTLYMLHQKDMRCEELQLELINLLEERDTLQLKLSKAIRQNEDIKQNFAKFCEDKQFPNIEIASAVSLQEQKYEVKPKLYLLSKTKDGNIAEHRERKLEIMEQDVANIPSEAVTQLVGVDMTNSTQSASTILLNWLWGKNVSNTS